MQNLRIDYQGLEYTTFWRKYLGIHIKRLIPLQSKMIMEDKKRDFYEAAYLQRYFENLDYYLVYLDEFHMNMRTQTLYNWSPRNSLAMLAINPDPFVMSFEVAFSSRGVEAIMAASKSINTTTFLWFLEDMLNHITEKGVNRNKICIIFDNSSVHTNGDSAKFISAKKIKWVTITPYSSQLNPAEKLIALVKNRLKQCWLNEKSLSLGCVKKIIDEISDEEIIGWIRASRTETFSKMKLLKFSKLTSKIRVGESKIQNKKTKNV